MRHSGERHISGVHGLAVRNAAGTTGVAGAGQPPPAVAGVRRGCPPLGIVRRAGEHDDALVGKGVAGADRKSSRVLALDRAGRLAYPLPDDVQAVASHCGRGHPEVAAVRPVWHPLPSVGASGGGARLHPERGRAGSLDRQGVVRIAVRTVGRAANYLAVDRERVPEEVDLAAVTEPDARGEIRPDRCCDAQVIRGQARLLPALRGSRAGPAMAEQYGRGRGDGCDQHPAAHRSLRSGHWRCGRAAVGGPPSPPAGTPHRERTATLK